MMIKIKINYTDDEIERYIKILMIIMVKQTMIEFSFIKNLSIKENIIFKI